MSTKTLERCIENINTMLEANPSLVSKDLIYNIDSFSWAKSLGPKIPSLALFLFQDTVTQSYLELDPDCKVLPIGKMYNITSSFLHVGFLLEFPRVATVIDSYMIVSHRSARSKPISHADVDLHVDNDHLQVYSDPDHSAQLVVKKKRDIISVVP